MVLARNKRAISFLSLFAPISQFAVGIQSVVQFGRTLCVDRLLRVSVQIRTHKNGEDRDGFDMDAQLKCRHIFWYLQTQMRINFGTALEIIHTRVSHSSGRGDTKIGVTLCQDLVSRAKPCRCFLNIGSRETTITAAKLQANLVREIYAQVISSSNNTEVGLDVCGVHGVRQFDTVIGTPKSLRLHTSVQDKQIIRQYAHNMPMKNGLSYEILAFDGPSLLTDVTPNVVACSGLPIFSPFSPFSPFSVESAQRHT